MFNLQGSEIIFILLLALVVLGPEKLPGAIRRATQTYHELRKLSNGFQSEFKSAIDEPMREMRATADLIKDQTDPRRIAADAERAAAAQAAADQADAQLVAEAEAEHSLEAEASRSIDEVRSAGDEPTPVDPFEDPVDDSFEESA